ncbi:MAG: tetratricopeptide repeat protein [Myxococcota bacterium]
MLFGATVGRAADESLERLLEAARADAEAGRCEQAQARLAPLEGLQNRARLLGGLCLIRRGHYSEALANFDRARGARDLTAAQLGDIELYRGVALYHLERYSEASAAFDAAEGLTSEPAELALYRGLIALRRGDDDAAAPDLEAAARLAPALTEPVASYYAGLAWQGVGRRDHARAAFQRVIDIDGEDGAWGRQAKTLLGATNPNAWSIRASAGLEYDDNVILRGGVTQFASPDAPATAGEKDGRGIWSIDGGLQLLEHGDVSAGVTAGYSGTAQFDLDTFDTHYPRIGAYVFDRVDPETTAQLRYEFGAAWVDGHSFLRTQLAEAALSHAWERAGTTILLADFLWNDLRFPLQDVEDGPGTPGGACLVGPTCGPAGLDERNARDRDGVGVGGAVEHRYDVGLPEGLMRTIEALRIGGGYRYRYYVSQGREWKHMSHVFSASLELDLPLDVGLTTRASYELRDFANPSTFPDFQPDGVQYALSSQDRREHQIDVVAELEKRITPLLSVSTRWWYTDNESNRRVYDYTRHVVGAYVNLRFE